MPYEIKGKTVVKKDSGKVVGHSDNPKAYMRTLNAVEHGWKPMGSTGKKKMSTSDGYMKRK